MSRFPSRRIVMTVLPLGLLVYGVAHISVTAPVRPLPVTVLCYHEISPDSTANKWIRNPEDLAADLDGLQRAGVRVIAFEEHLQALKRGDSMTGHGVVLTFDDATAGQFRYARPLLQAHGYPATFYVPTGAVDKGWPVSSHYTGTMTWKDLRTLDKEGFQLACHSHNHKALSRLSELKLEMDLRQCLKRLYEKTGVQTRDLCLPSGRYESFQEAYILNLGFRSMALTTTDHGPGRPGLIKVRRFEVLAATDPHEVVARVTGHWENE